VRPTTLLAVLTAVVLLEAGLNSEAQDRRGAALERRFQELDTSGDGKLSRAELGDAQQHASWDRDQDGFVTQAEVREFMSSIRRAQSLLAAAPPATVAEGIDVDARPSAPPAAVPVANSRAFAHLAFARDWVPGTKDGAGERMTGTETVRLLAHGGRLFAATGCWMDLPYGRRDAGQPPWTGPQILVKDSAQAAWRVDVSWPMARRVTAILSTRFVTDGEGQALDPPVNLLVAGPISSRLKNTSVWSRDDASGTWAESVVLEDVEGGVRSFCTHRDRVTGVQSLFGGLASGAVCRAVYDPSVPGRLRWDRTPELSGTGRVMCLAEANGVLYAAGGIRNETPLSGGLFRRVDGASPRWELVWRWPHRIVDRGDEPEILRGLTAVPDPLRCGQEVLLGTCSYPGVIYRIDPARGFAATTELDIRKYFAKAFGVPALRGPCLSAYNDFLPAADPDTGESVHLLGVWILHPAGQGTPEGASAWYLVRHGDGTYSHGRVFDPAHPVPNPPRGLLAARTLAISPFPEDKGRVLDAGGFDCARIESRDTAWIYRGEIAAQTAKAGSQGRCFGSSGGVELGSVGTGGAKSSG